MMRLNILSNFVLISCLGCSNCPDYIDQFYIDIDPLYQIYYSGNIEYAEEALLKVISLGLEYKECGLNSIPQLMVANYRLFLLNEYKGDKEISHYYLDEAKKYYNMLGQGYGYKNEKSAVENLQTLFFNEIEGQNVPIWRQH